MFPSISIHALREESDTDRDAVAKTPKISIHALREESDFAALCTKRRQNNFNPRPPRGERRSTLRRRQGRQKISIHALREESDGGIRLGYKATVKFQSTPSARRATGIELRVGQDVDISIHALREESDLAQRRVVRADEEFQSTPSARRATVAVDGGVQVVLDFNPRPPRGERRTEHGLRIPALKISIHALREESD